MKSFSAKLRETVVLKLRAQTKTLNLGVQVNKFCLFSTSAYTQGAPIGSREVLFAEFETKFFFISVQNSKKPETVWLWISKYNKIVKHGRSLYLNVEPLSSNSSL